MVKRIFDLIVATVGLIVTGPVLLVLGLLIKLDSPGPVLYQGVRAGQGGVPFKMYKLRTMVLDADTLGPMLTRSEDARITRIGRVLRRWKIDEVPQLLNVLRGEMSIVGPRPECCAYVKHYSLDQAQVLSVRPGITGPAQVKFRHEETTLQNCANLEEEYVNEIMPRKLALDIAYVHDHTVCRDLAVIAATFLSLFSKPPIGEEPKLGYVKQSL